MTPQSTFYWHLVHDCLVEFHSQPPKEARKRVRDFRLRMEKAPKDVDADIVFHDEPFALACRLAGRGEIEPSGDEQQKYAALIEECAKNAAALGTDEELRKLARFGKAA